MTCWNRKMFIPSLCMQNYLMLLCVVKAMNSVMWSDLMNCLFLALDVLYSFHNLKLLLANFCVFNWNQFKYIEICFFLLFSFCNLHANSLLILLEKNSYDGTFIWSICRSVWVWCWEGKHLFCWVHFPVSLTWLYIFRISIKFHCTYWIE